MHHEKDSDNGFVVDEEGNAVRYDNDEDYDEDVQKVQLSGEIIKFLGNMQQDTKNSQNTKVDKKKSTKFLTYMKNNKIKSLDDCDNFRNTNHISKMEMFKIIIEHPQKLKYQGYKLYYK